MKLSDLCEASDAQRVGETFVNSLYFALRGQDFETASRLGFEDMGLFHAYGARHLYRVGDWLVKADISTHRWIVRERNLHSYLRGITGIVRPQSVRHPSGDVLVLPWIAPRPIGMNHVSKLRDKFDELAVWGVMLLDCPLPTIVANGDRDILMLDFGRFKRADPNAAQVANRERLLEAAEKMALADGSWQSDLIEDQGVARVQD